MVSVSIPVDEYLRINRSGASSYRIATSASVHEEQTENVQLLLSCNCGSLYGFLLLHTSQRKNSCEQIVTTDMAEQVLMHVFKNKV